MFMVNPGFMCDNPGMEGLKVGRKAFLYRPNGFLDDFEKWVFL